MHSTTKECVSVLKKNFLKDTAPPLTGVEKMFSSYCMSILEPIKMNYDNYRFDISKPIAKNNAVLECFLRHFFTKSDEWIYEKEHRSILSYLQATHALVTDPNNTRTINLEHDSYTVKLSSYIKKHLDSGYLIETKYKNIYEFSKNMASIIEMSNLSGFSGISFLKKVEPQSIKEIYFGCRADKKEVEKIYNLLQSENHPLNHVKLYSFEISGKRFEMHAKEISSNSFN